MVAIDSSLVQDLVAALFCGAFIGMERERGKISDAGAPNASPDARNLAGIRSHILVALLGALLSILDRDENASAPLVALGFAALALFVTSAYAIRAVRSGRYGTTSVPTLFLTFALGVLCMSGQRPLALAMAVVVTAILMVKLPLHAFIRGLKREEATAAVRFGLVALVLLPLLPDRDFGPNDWPWLAERLRGWSVAEDEMAQLALFNPQKLWLLVVIISGVGFVGYVLVRALGPGRGLVVTGFAGGLVSSTAVSLAMGEQSKRTPKLKDSIVAAVLAACSVMAVRVLLVSAALHASLFATLGPPLGLMMVANLLLAWWLSRRSGPETTDSRFEVSTPFAILPGLKLAGLILLVRVLCEVAMLLIGDAGLLLMAAVSGLVDVDAIAISTAQQSAAGRIGVGFATAAICIAVAVNTLAKGTLVYVTGERKTGITAAVALLATLAAGALGWLISVAVRGGLT